MAEEAEQSRQHTQGIQRHLHGSNEDGMLQGLDSISSLWGHCGVWFLSLVQFVAVASNFFLAIQIYQMTLGVRLWSYVREEASHGRVIFSSTYSFQETV